MRLPSAVVGFDTWFLPGSRPPLTYRVEVVGTMRCAAVVASLLPLVALGTAAPAPVELFRFADPRITESSGLTTSTRHEGIVWTHNDSNGGPHVYAVDASGETVARITLADLDPYDWEGIARLDDLTLWLGDIGDNRSRRDTIALFRVEEPAELSDGPASWTRFRFAYPDGPHDAEALLLDPRDGRVLVATKSVIGGTLYGSSPLHDLSAEDVNPLVAVGSVPPLVTDGAYAPDGETFALRGYGSAWLYSAPDRQIGEIKLPEMPQGESVTWTADGSALLVGTEGESAPVWRIPVPQQVLAAAAEAAESDADRDTGLLSQLSFLVPIVLLGLVIAVALSLVTVLESRRGRR